MIFERIDNQMSVEGAKALANLLKVNTRLSGIYIGSEAVIFTQDRKKCNW